MNELSKFFPIFLIRFLVHGDEDFRKIVEKGSIARRSCHGRMRLS